MAEESTVRNQPIKHPALGALATLLRNVDEFGRKPFGYDNPPVALLSDLVGLPSVHRTLERASRGAPLTSGTGWTTMPLQDTTQALFAAPGIAQGIGALGKVAGRGTLAGMNAIMADAAPAGSIPMRRLRQAGAIKPKGGNWLKGDVERSLESLKNARVHEPIVPIDKESLNAAAGGDIWQKMLDEEWAKMPQTQRPTIGSWIYEKYPELYPQFFKPDGPKMAANEWVDKQLTRYVKNDMATPEDPVRQLADQGILHVDPDQINFRPEMYGKYLDNGQTLHAKSDLAKIWEGAADNEVDFSNAGNGRFSDRLDENPWLLKVPPDTKVYTPLSPTGAGLQSNLGFQHLMDELRNAMNPASGLPPELLLKYSSLNQVSVPQAVERVAKINAWRAAQQAEADALKANNAATFTHKEYPETGMRWVELRSPDQDGAREILGDALKYEGDTMGHCVGGYCDDVASGATRIYSLRDAKGQPHVTIEVKPESQMLDEELLAQIKRREPMGTPSTYERMLQEARQPSIVQIKGKGNKAPKDDYLPYVQDFVQSGEWGNIGDLSNAGMIDLALYPDRMKALGSRYVTNDQHNSFLDDQLLRDLDDNVKGFAVGGAVHACTSCAGNQDDFNPDLINEMAAQLHEELHGR